VNLSTPSRVATQTQRASMGCLEALARLPRMFQERGIYFRQDAESGAFFRNLFTVRLAAAHNTSGRSNPGGSTS
jgi:hypothetical protein